jgi:hypothetical protein
LYGDLKDIRVRSFVLTGAPFCHHSEQNRELNLLREYCNRVLANLKRRASGWASFCKLFHATLRWLFLRKAAAFFAREAT